MNGNNNVGAGNKRNYRTFKVNPTTKAIRAALAVSATMLALAGSTTVSAAWDCDVTGGAEVTCTGTFLNDVTGYSPETPVDLTLIVGTIAGETTVDPPMGVSGITSYWGGEATVISYAEINTDGADGIHMESNYNGSVFNHGSITTVTSGPGNAGIFVYADNDITVVNSGSVSIDTDSVYAVDGIYADSDGYVTIDNQAGATITAGANGGSAYGINVWYADDGANVNNSGSIFVDSFSGATHGIYVYADEGDATVTNSGYISSLALGNQSTGIFAYSEDENANVTNSGTIIVEAQGYAEGIYAESNSGGGDATVTNSGTLDVTSYDSGAVGIKAYGKYADITNSGPITVAAEDNATGISAYGYDGVDITNSGPITVTAYDFDADAAGISAESGGGITIINNGDITVTSNGSADGPVVSTLLPEMLPWEIGADAVGISAISDYDGEGEQPTIDTLMYGYGPNDVNEINTVDILVVAAGNGVGMYAAAFGAGNVYMSNEGTVTVLAGGYGVGMWGQADTGTIEILSSGDIVVQSTNLGATGIYAESTGDGGTVTITNSAGVDAYSEFDYAIGIWAQSFGIDGDIAIENSGNVYAESYDNYAIGVVAYSWNDYNDVSVVTTGGLIDAYSYNDYATGIEALAYGYESTIYVNNGGDINAESFWSDATGIAGTTRYDAGSLEIQNSGSVYVLAWGDAMGIAAFGNGAYGDTTVSNSGTLDVTSEDSYAMGIYAFSSLNDVYVDNSGSISVDASYARAYGIYASAYVGNIDVQNSGTITVTQVPNFYGAYGIYSDTEGNYATTNIDNSGSISVVGQNWTYGVWALAHGDYSSVSVTNSGTVDATSDGNWGTGLYAWSNGYESSLYLGNSGTINASGYETAKGINAGLRDLGYIEINNSGSIDVYAEGSDSGRAFGIYAFTYGAVDGSTILVDNSGTIGATGVRDAYGIYTIANYDGLGGGEYTTTDIYNSGSITATSYETDAYGIAAFAGGFDSYVMVDNSGTVNATGYHAATGIVASIAYNLGYADVYNSGSISAHAEGDVNTDATGIFARAYDAYVSSDGSAYAYATGEGARTSGIEVVGKYATLVTGSDSYTGAVSVGSDYAIAEGAVVVSNGIFDGITDVYANGEIYASATADAEAGSATASGITTLSFYGAYVEVGEDGVIDVHATGYAATAYGVLELAGYAYFYNHGDISATVDGVEGYAFGARISSPNQVYAYNYGHITATAYGEGTQSVGIVVESTGNSAGVYNSGYIYAYADNIATGVWLATDTIGYVYNHGVIAAYGGVYSLAVYSSGASTDYINNYGDIVGEIWSGAGNDYLYNSEDGSWFTSGYSYFGDGDDGIWNDGLIAMENAYIDLGYHDVTGNYFYNYGTITVSGDENVIHMGHGPAGPAVPSLNPLPFNNYGTIDFQDGDPDDELLIVGDFAGDGNINVDVSGLSETSDILYIDGSVVAGTAGVINVDLLDLPDSIESLIPIVYVTGNSVDGNFVLGDINWDEDNTFVTLDFGIVSDIDATNATPDVFSLGIEVTGLSDPGTLAASIGPSMISLVNTQVGTWRQRMGVIDSFSKGAVALWARVFSSEGSFQPEHTAGNFGLGGNFDWEQKNSGVEGGIDFSVTDEFSIGLLVAKAQADTDLEAGVGSADLDADTWGIYGTWISPNGFYLDASYRWTNFDIDLSSVAGPMETEGDAETFNIEVGYAWTLSGGLKIEPQLQYTKTTIDSLDVLHTINGMTFSYDDADSSRGRLGVAIRKSFGEADTGWVWTPYAAVSVVREFDGEALYAINNTFVGESDMEGTSVLVELGFTARHQNWAVYGGLNFEDGGALEGWFGGQLGVRYTFGGPAPAPAPVVVPPAKTCADLDDDGDGINNCDDKCLGSTAGEAVGPDGCPIPPEPVMEPKPFRG